MTATLDTYAPAEGRLARLRVRCGKLPADTYGRLFTESRKHPGEWWVEFNQRVDGCPCGCLSVAPHLQRLSVDHFDVVRG